MKRNGEAQDNKQRQLGGQRVVPPYREPKNSPFIPNAQKQIYGERIAENAPKEITVQGSTQGQTIVQTDKSKLNPIVNLQVYQPPKPKDTKLNIPSLFYPPSVPTPYFPPQYSYQLPPYMMNSAYQPNPVSVIKAYNINIDGVTGDHTKLNLIYEDILPSKQFAGTTTTIGERINVYNFVRAMMFQQGDGKNIGLDGKSDDTILSHLKFMDLNPYNTYKFSNNPYKGLPLGFLIYRSCYPIRHDASESTVVCARNSVGTNIRIYNMTQGSYQVNSQSQKKFNDFDEWREISYYEYIREQIIKKKECPNFVILYGYYISENSRIDFDKIALFRGVQTKTETTYLQNPPLLKPIIEPKQCLIPSVPCNNCPQFIAQVGGDNANNDTGNNLSEDTITEGILSGLLNNSIDKSIYQDKTENIVQSQNGGQVEINLRLNPNAFLGKAMVAMTEAPNYNLFGWASKTYQMDGNIRRQINTGFHLDKVWYSVLFQIMVALYCMQIHKIYFSDFTVEDNIYIKDISAYGAAARYWKYKIDGIDYYIPNYGYVVVIDSNFKDIIDPNTMMSLANCIPDKKIYKIHAKFLDCDISDEEIKIKTFDAFRKAMDCNIYDQSFINFGGCKPPPEVLFLLNQIGTQSSVDTDKNIGKYLYTFMRRFMNNRVGSYLKETEIQNIRRDEQKDFLKGQIVVYEDGSSSFKFVIFLNLSGIGVANILSKNDPTNEDIIEMQVPITSLYGYTRMEPIVQNFKPNESNLNEEDLLETYIMNKY